jgi:hypothetical protein
MSQIESLAAVEAAKEQPWKAFWPLKGESFTEEQTAQMPWLSYAPDPEKPDIKPWYSWLREESVELTSTPGYVCRSGGSNS